MHARFQKKVWGRSEVKFFIVQFGSRRHYAVPRILFSAGLLDQFYTDICAIQGWPRVLNVIPGMFLPKSLKRLKGRIPTGVPVELITSFPLLGLVNQAKLISSSSFGETLRVHAWTSSTLNKMIIKKGIPRDTILYSFDRAGLELMQEVKRCGGKCVMEQTVAPFKLWQRLNLEEQALFPGWEAAWDSDEDLTWFSEREQQEWALADLIICGSEFVRDGIDACGGPVERCCVIPYGTNSATKTSRPQLRKPGPLRVLTVGEVGLRKGSQYVLAVAKQLQKKAIFRMVGSTSLSDNATHELSKYVELTGQVPRTEIASHYQWADIFLLPSLLEGSAGVVYEALGYGLPVICTPNTGSVVRDGHNGYIVPIRDIETTCKILYDLIKNRDKLTAMSEKALLSDGDYSFDIYKERLSNRLKNFAANI